MTGGVPGGSVTSKQLQRMVTALDLASDKGSTVEAELLQAKSKALLYEVWIRGHARCNVCLVCASTQTVVPITKILLAHDSV